MEDTIQFFNDIEEIKQRCERTLKELQEEMHLIEDWCAAKGMTVEELLEAFE